MEITQYKTAVLDGIFVKNQFKLPEINKVDSKEIKQKVDKTTDNIFDILGTYNSDNGKITMYTEMIEEFAKDLKVKYEIVYNIVYTHEIGHLYSHKAMDELNGNSTWNTESFQNSSSEINEGLAQLFTHWEFEKSRKYLKVFEKMLKYQPPVYHGYKDAIPISKKDMLNNLRLFRKHILDNNLTEKFNDKIIKVNDKEQKEKFINENLNKDSPGRGKAALLHSGLFD